MTKIRDLLIVVVLGGTVLFAMNDFATRFVSDRQQHQLSVNPTYGRAVAACEEDDRVCSFFSIESAESYLKSPEHLSSVQMRELKARQNQAAADKSTLSNSKPLKK